MVRLARRNSLAGIMSLFKDKEKKEKEKDGDGKQNKSKGVKAEASVSQVTAETDSPFQRLVTNTGHGGT